MAPSATEGPCQVMAPAAALGPPCAQTESLAPGSSNTAAPAIMLSTSLDCIVSSMAIGSQPASPGPIDECPPRTAEHASDLSVDQARMITVRAGARKLGDRVRHMKMAASGDGRSQSGTGHRRLQTQSK